MNITFDGATAQEIQKKITDFLSVFGGDSKVTASQAKLEEIAKDVSEKTAKGKATKVKFSVSPAPKVEAKSPESLFEDEAPKRTDEVQPTKDDVLKVARLLSQSPDGIKKLGDVLKSHGAAKVSDIPATKYQDFMGDCNTAMSASNA